MAKVVELDYCPRCLEPFDGIMTRISYSVRWCYLCSFDVEDASAGEREREIQGAKERAREEF